MKAHHFSLAVEDARYDNVCAIIDAEPAAGLDCQDTREGCVGFVRKRESCEGADSHVVGKLQLGEFEVVCTWSRYLV